MDHSRHNHDDSAMNTIMNNENNNGSVCGMDGMMKMYFHTGYCENAVLFSIWKIGSIPVMIGSCIGIFWMAVLYEGLKVFREYLLTRTAKNCCRVAQCPSYYGAKDNNNTDGACNCDKEWRPHHPCGWPHLLQTVLHMVQVVLSYFLMLIFMTFNVWLCLAVVIGAGAGYLAFAWSRRAGMASDSMEHCH